MGDPTRRVWVCETCGKFDAAAWSGCYPTDPNDGLICEGTPVERLLVDPATTREGWLDRHGLDGPFTIAARRSDKHNRAVLVLSAPVKPKDSSPLPYPPEIQDRIDYGRYLRGHGTHKNERREGNA